MRALFLALIVVALAGAFVLGYGSLGDSDRANLDPAGASEGAEEGAAARESGGDETKGGALARGLSGSGELRRQGPDREIPDPVLAMQLGARIDDLWADEPRDPAWAPQVERFLADQMQRYVDVLVPEATELGSECRQSICQVWFTVSSASEDAFTLQQLLPLGSRMQPWVVPHPDDPDKSRLGMTILYDAGSRPLGSLKSRYDEWYRERFPEGLEEFKRTLDLSGTRRPPAGGP